MPDADADPPRPLPRGDSGNPVPWTIPVDQPDPPTVLEDLRTYAEADGALLDDLADVFDALRARAGTLTDDVFDAERIWARVDRELFG